MSVILALPCKEKKSLKNYLFSPCNLTPAEDGLVKASLLLFQVAKIRFQELNVTSALCY